MRLEATFNDCSGVQQFAASAANWIGQTASTVGSAIATSAQKVADFVRPLFESLKSFAHEHQQGIFIFSLGTIVGAFALHVINTIFCRGTNTPPPESTATTATTTTATATV